VRGRERGPGCHPERSEGSLRPASQTFAEFTLSEANGLRVTGILSKCPVRSPHLPKQGMALHPPDESQGLSRSDFCEVFALSDVLRP